MTRNLLSNGLLSTALLLGSFSTAHASHKHHRHHPGSPDNLIGGCADDDHSQFMVAKDFAYSTDGVNLSSAGAIDWALKYNETHRCGTIQEFAQRFTLLKQYAYSTEYLNMSTQESVRYALERADFIPATVMPERMALFTEVKDFFYSTNYLNSDTRTAVNSANQWVDRGSCGDQEDVTLMKGVYEREYQFAYSTSGLNKSSAGAKQYAIQKLYPLTPCSDLLK